ncbi:hypothetical protein, partial [Staphylococcus aureus]|uniref:hypothetical protein n=1 Tax=Staphylococcus aureus TaxID=1280 RepID=UPI003F9548EA
ISSLNNLKQIAHQNPNKQPKQPATGKVVLIPTHRGTVSSGTEGSVRTLEGATVSSKSGNQLFRMSVPKG